MITPRVAWLACGDMNSGSSRLEAFLPQRYLKENGWVSDMLYYGGQEYSIDIEGGIDAKLEEWASLPYDIFVLQKLFGDRAIEFTNKVHKNGKLVMLATSDAPVTYDKPEEMFRLIDSVITPSRYLSGTILAAYGVPLVHTSDPPWDPTSRGILKTDYSIKGKRPLAVWFGNPGQNFFLVQTMKEWAGTIGWDIRTITKHKDADKQWSLETVWNDIIECDVAIIPVDYSEFSKCKSAGRLIQCMYLGMPTIVGALPAYIQVGTHPLHYILAYSRNDWENAFKVLGNDSDVRSIIGNYARAYVESTYSPEAVGLQWERALKSLWKHGRRRNG